MDLLTFRRNDLILGILLPGLYVADLAYGILLSLNVLLPVTPGILLRGAVMGWAVVMIFNYFRILPPHYVFGFWGFAIVSILAPLFAGIDTLNPASIARDILAYTKLIYFPSVALLFLILLRLRAIDADRILLFIEAATYFVGIVLFISQVSGVGQSTYGEFATGDKGIFKAQNDIGLTCLVGLCVCTYKLVISRNPGRLVLLVITMIAVLGIGTRASLLGIVPVGAGVLLSFLFASDAKSLSRGTRAFGWLMLISASIIAAFLLYNTYADLTSQAYHKRKMDSLIEGELPRQVLIDEAIYYFDERNVVESIVGVGFTEYTRNVGRFLPGSRPRSAEVDPIDILGMYGWITVIYIYTAILIALYSLAKRFQNYRKNIDGVVLTMFSIFLGHSLLAGHALMSPIVSTILASAWAYRIYDVNLGKMRQKPSLPSFSNTLVRPT